MDAVLADDLATIARQARQKGWWQPYADVLPEKFGAAVDFEAAAISIFAYQTLLIPGLLQTEAYARALIAARWPMAGPSLTAQRIQVRIARQDLLTRDDPPLLWVVLDEAALRREVGDIRTRRGQLNRLMEVTDLPNVMIQVIPFSSGPHASMDGSFRILTFADQADRPIIHMENLVGSLLLEEPAEVDRYSLVFDRLRASALGPPESLSLIGRIADELDDH